MFDPTRGSNHRPVVYSSEIIRTVDPNYQATNCCGSSNRGVDIKEDVHYCIACGKGFQLPQPLKEMDGPHVITAEKMFATVEELGRQGLLDELNNL